MFDGQVIKDVASAARHELRLQALIEEATRVISKKDKDK